jgi:hypothetical protein
MRAVPPRDPQNHLAVAFVRSLHRAEPVDPDLIQPDGALAPLGCLGLVGHRAQRRVAAIASKAASAMAMRIMGLTATFRYFIVGFHSRAIRCASAI